MKDSVGDDKLTAKEYLTLSVFLLFVLSISAASIIGFHMIFIEKQYDMLVPVIFGAILGVVLGLIRR